METRKYNVYKFDELTEEQRQKVLENYASINVDYEWWESLYDDAETVGIKITAFDLDRSRQCEGDFIEDAEDTAKKIIEEHGEACETWGTATNYLADRAALVKKYSDDIIAEGNECDFDNDCEELDAEFLRSILEDYSILLQKEYDYMTSEEAIIETLSPNDYYFTKDGKID